ncbi:hypothetical protein ARMGADRAFT_1039063 [Armillaria gallica]|uniref:Uncharacterized protein n=1 Tax=Armillaria gallica TaxID=47427 RepID=A0A2H3CKI5_ARMGA|nr:hypothetical protein ARMGADRAFT_1039063 [Armillaria gallica]
MILATHELVGSLPPIPTRSTNPPPPKLSSRQKETFYVSSVEGPIVNVHKTFATPIIRPDSEAGLLCLLERELWAYLRPESEQVVPGAGYTTGIYARVLITRFCGPLWMFGKPRLRDLA